MSKTLGLIFAYWTGDLKSEVGPGYIQLPFNIEKFCAHNDVKIAELEQELTKLMAQLAQRDEAIKVMREALDKLIDASIIYGHVNQYDEPNNILEMRLSAELALLKTEQILGDKHEN